MDLDRRRFLGTLSSAGTAGLCATNSVAEEAPPETTTIRLAKNQSLCIQPQYVAEDLLRAEGSTTVSYVMTDGGVARLSRPSSSSPRPTSRRSSAFRRS